MDVRIREMDEDLHAELKIMAIKKKVTLPIMIVEIIEKGIEVYKNEN